ncbi:MAG TPA: MFS transporter, partial [Miltoncostaeaceae bacterium]|nr:MFS transporter [Miltoncostaeaceae bacterium]
HALRRPTVAAYAVFILSGVTFASWASRIPAVRDALALSPRGLGLVLLSIALGSVTAMPLAGLVVARVGTTRTVAVAALVAAAGLAVAGAGDRWGVTAVVLGLFALGAGNGTWDVAMNVEGAAVERERRRPLLPRLHAGFSVGTVVGALGGALTVALGVPTAVHLGAVAVVVAVAAPLAARGFLPRGAAPEDGPRPHPLGAWRERRTLLVGVFVFAAAFTEGTGNDWLGVAMVDGHGAGAALAALALAAFLAAMTLGRWFGPALIARHGRIASVRMLGVVALAGLALVVWGPALPVAIAGAALWGLGTALGFPVGMSAAGDDAAHAAGRVSVVATIGYVAFLAGPPLIGMLVAHTGILRALTLTAGLVALGLLVSGALRPPPASPPTSPGVGRRPA